MLTLIDDFVKLIQELKRECPHYRIGQAIVNSLTDDDLDKLFYLEDVALVRILKEHKNKLAKLNKKEDRLPDKLTKTNLQYKSVEEIIKLAKERK